jgi:hypothetical protein
VSTLWRDIVYGIRMLAAKPGFAIAAILSLALGIGANTTIFSFIHSTLLAELPFPEADRVVTLWGRPLDRPDARLTVTAQTYLAWKERSRSFESVGAIFGFPSNLGGEVNGAPAERLEGLRFTASMWEVLRVQPQLGRVFTPEEDRDLTPAPVMVLSHALWQRRFGGAADIVAHGAAGYVTG